MATAWKGDHPGIFSSAYCPGDNGYGQLGDGTGEDRYEPVPVLGDITFRVVVAGGGSGHGHTCGISTGGATYCWGWNRYGQLGNQTNPEAWNEPIPVWR
jgi:alpha-tubulin suppressor-like RCC1 family protein